MNNTKNKRQVLFIGMSILIITLLHYFTISTKWDIHDFYRRLYYIPIIVSAFSFRLKGGVISSFIISALYAPHLVLYFGKIDMAILNQFFEIIMFIIIGTITGYLVESDFKKKFILELQIKKLTDLENYTRNILDSITNVVIGVDNNLNIKSINKEGEDLFSLAKEEGLKNIRDFFIDYKEVELRLKEIIENEKKLLNMETKCRSKTRGVVDIKLKAYPLRNIVNNIEGLVLVLEDISEIRKLENQVRRTEKLSAIGELASGVAHEIRNPMGIIKTIAQTTYEEVKEEDIKEGLKIIIHEINRANIVIKGLLNYAKPGIKETKLIDINKVIEDIIIITKKYAENHRVEINFQAAKDLLALIDIDSLKQCFINIIFNAVQAMPNGGSLDIRTNIEENWIKVACKDTGIGIPKEKIEKIFEPFYTTKDSGTGLGLAITHRIIEEHNGYIEVESEINKGTIVYIYLPLEEGNGEDDNEKNSNSR